MELATNKTELIDFNKAGLVKQDIEITVGEDRVVGCRETKFLGVWLDNRLHFKKQVQYIKDKIKKANGILKNATKAVRGYITSIIYFYYYGSYITSII